MYVQDIGDMVHYELVYHYVQGYTTTTAWQW